MVGRVTTQGDRALRSNIARTLFGLDGSGIRIGVISNAYNSDGGANAEVQAGDLPGRANLRGRTRPVRVLRDNRLSPNDEGRAMLQIIHDLAPGAELLFHTVGNSEADMADAIRALANAGADIIVDDIGFPGTLLLQDGVLAEAIAEVTARGVAYFSSAGNDGDRGYQSTFRAGGTFKYQGITYEAHNFSTTGDVDLFQAIQIPDSKALSINLNWDQPQGQLENNVDAFLLSTAELPGYLDNAVPGATISELSAQEPVIRLIYEPPQAETVYLLIARRVEDAAPPPGYLVWTSVANNADAGVVVEYVNDSPTAPGGATVYGHPNTRDAIAIGAASFRNTPEFGVAVPLLEPFSSRGGIPVLFSVAGDRLPAPEIRQKPALVAVDQVSTTVPGFEQFSGTSAAAPHAAAVAALVLQRAGGRGALTPAQLLAILEQSALPIDPPGNLRSGAGLLQADGAVLQAATTLAGTDVDETLIGTPQADNLYGQQGDDRLYGLQQFDALWGGAGSDTVMGGQGNDYGIGDSGDDWLVGGTGQDLLLGGSGNDRLYGTGGRDRLRGGAGDDLLHGGRGTNWLTGYGGADQFVLSKGAFAIIRDFGRGADRLALTAGLSVDQLIIAEQGQDTLIQHAGAQLALLRGVNAASLTAARFITL